MLACLATGVVITLASGELRADRDVGLELLRANEALSARVERQDGELAELRALVEASAGKPTGPNTGPSAPGTPPKTKSEADLEEKFAFRVKALEALKPELAEIDRKQVAAKATHVAHVEAYAKHYHEYDVVAHGWVRLDAVLTGDGQDLLRPTYADDWFATVRTDNGKLPSDGSLTKSTTAPKK